MPAINISQGTSEAFSTGSHAQYPPKVKLSYAQAAPIIIPTPKIAPENAAHGKQVLSSLYDLGCISRLWQKKKEQWWRQNLKTIWADE